MHHAHPFRLRLEFAAMTIFSVGKGPEQQPTLEVLQECKQIASLGCTVERIRQCCELIRSHSEGLLQNVPNDTDQLEALQIALLLRQVMFGPPADN